MKKITESAIEQYSIELLEKHGFDYIYGLNIAPDSQTPARYNFNDVLLQKLKNYEVNNKINRKGFLNNGKSNTI